jgi:hypothetical protein
LERRRHHNAILIRKDFYWAVGGFDENFDGYYGTAQFFGKAAERLQPFVQLDELWLDMITTNEVEDANTVSQRRTNSLVDRAAIRMKRLARHARILPRKTLSHPYEQVF